jgi:hypothetical protein
MFMYCARFEVLTVVLVLWNVTLCHLVSSSCVVPSCAGSSSPLRIAMWERRVFCVGVVGVNGWWSSRG